jgi:hypothetical protein
MKSYLQFVKESKNILDIDIEDIRDISLDLIDDDIEAKIKNINYHFRVSKEDTKNYELWGESIDVPAIFIKLNDSMSRFFRWNDISNFINRLVSFLGDSYEIIINNEDDFTKLKDFIDDSQEEYYMLCVIIYEKLDN